MMSTHESSIKAKQDLIMPTIFLQNNYIHVTSTVHKHTELHLQANCIPWTHSPLMGHMEAFLLLQGYDRWKGFPVEIMDSPDYLSSWFNNFKI